MAAQTAQAGGVVSAPTDANLRAALADGGSVTFAVDGIITLTNTINITGDTVLDGAGHNVTISGGQSVRLFAVVSNVTFDLRNLTLADGLAAGGVTNFNYFNGVGGAISNAGSLYITHCIFTNNTALGRGGVDGDPNSSAGSGGAIYSVGTLVISNTIFAGNAALGGNGAIGVGPSAGKDGSGGGIYNAGDGMIFGCAFISNRVAGGHGGDFPIGAFCACSGEKGGNAHGAGIFNTGSVSVRGSTFLGNLALGGKGGKGGGGPYTQAGPGGVGGQAGTASGAAACCTNGTFSLLNCTLFGNLAQGGEGGDGGSGGDGALHNQPGGDGGPGERGGNASGGGICCIGGTVSLTNVTCAGNTSTGGAGGVGGSGGSGGPAGPTGAMGTNGSPGTAVADNISATSGSVVMLNTIVSGNSVGPNVSGSITDAGNNICSDASGTLTQPTSMNSTEPRLGPLTDNGGSTLTMALLSGSPAIDAGVTVPGLDVDQRGISRPFGMAPDIGAYELSSPVVANFTVMPPVLINGSWHLRVAGPAMASVRFQESVDLLNWSDISTNVLGLDGTAEFQTDESVETGSYYRTVSP